MLEWMEKTIEDLKEKDYWEKHHKHSELAKFAIDICIKESEIGELQVTEEDVIDDEDIDISISFALLWILHRAKEEGFKFDYMNDSMSFVDDWEIIDVAASFGSAYSRRYNNPDRLYTLKCDVTHEYDLNTIEHIDAAAALVIGEPLIGNQCVPVCDLAIELHDCVHGCRTSNIEPMIYENYNRILDKVIYDSDNIDLENRIKVNEIRVLLYKIARCINMDAVRESCRIYGFLPKYMMIYIYVLLNNYAANYDDSKVCMGLITGDIEKIGQEEFEEIQTNLLKYFE